MMMMMMMIKTKKTNFCHIIDLNISNSSIAGRPPNSDFLIGFGQGENLTKNYRKHEIFEGLESRRNLGVEARGFAKTKTPTRRIVCRRRGSRNGEKGDNIMFFVFVSLFFSRARVRSLYILPLKG